MNPILALLLAVPTSVILLLLAIAGALALQRESQKRAYKFAPKGNLGFWVIGEMLEYFSVSSQHLFFTRRITTYGTRNFTSHLLLNPVACIGEYEDRDYVLASETKGMSVVAHPSHWQLLLGKKAVSVVTGEDHHRMRKLFAPFLTVQAMRQHVNVVDKVVCEWLDEHATKAEFMHCFELKTLAITILFQTIFAGNATREEMEQMNHEFQIYMTGFGALFPVPLGEYNCLGRAMDARRRLVKMIETILTRFQARGEEGRGKGGLLESMINARGDQGEQFTELEILDNLVVLCFAGNDTTQSIMGSLLAVLFTEGGEEHLSKLRLEIEENLKPEDELDFDKLKNLPWLNAVINEAVRYKNPVSLACRMALEDLSLSDGSIVPKGQSFGYYPSSSNFDVDYFGANVDEFDPNRYFTLKDNGDELRKHLILFGRGVRLCPGEHLARLELRVFLVRIAQKYTFEVKDKKEVVFPMNMLQSNLKVIKL